MEASEWRKACKPQDTLYTVLIIDPLVRLIFPVVIRAGLTPNQITLFRFVLCFGIFGAFSAGYGALGATGFLLWYFLDCIDGKLARYKGLASPFGDWLDRTTDRIGIGFVFVGEGLYLESLGRPWALPACLVFLSLWLFGITNALMFRPLRKAYDINGSGQSSSAAASQTAGAGWKAWLRQRRLSLFFFQDVEWLHLAIVVGGFTGEVTFVWIATAAMGIEKLLESLFFWGRRWHLVILENSSARNSQPPASASEPAASSSVTALGESPGKAEAKET